MDDAEKQTTKAVMGYISWCCFLRPSTGHVGTGQAVPFAKVNTTRVSASVAVNYLQLFTLNYFATRANRMIKNCIFFEIGGL